MNTTIFSKRNILACVPQGELLTGLVGYHFVRSALIKRQAMFVSVTDWEFDGNVKNAVEAAKGFWLEMKKYGAINMRATVTGENTL